MGQKLRNVSVFVRKLRNVIGCRLRHPRVSQVERAHNGIRIVFFVFFDREITAKSCILLEISNRQLVYFYYRRVW